MSFPKKGKFFPKRGDPNSSNGDGGSLDGTMNFALEIAAALERTLQAAVRPASRQTEMISRPPDTDRNCRCGQRMLRTAPPDLLCAATAR